MDEYELEIIEKLGCGVVYCLIVNLIVGGGFMVVLVREFLDKKIKVGFGMDSGGGFFSSMLDVMW